MSVEESPLPGHPDAEVAIDISDFSSLAMGAVRFHSLYAYGLTEVSNPACVEALGRLFAVPQKPRCTAAF